MKYAHYELIQEAFVTYYMRVYIIAMNTELEKNVLSTTFIHVGPEFALDGSILRLEDLDLLEGPELLEQGQSKKLLLIHDIYSTIWAALSGLIW